MNRTLVAYFSASGSSGFGNTAAELRPSAPGAEITESRVLSGVLTDAKLRALADELGK